MEGTHGGSKHVMTFTVDPPTASFTATPLESIDGEVQIRVSGEIDVTSGPAFQEQVEEFAIPRAHLVLDLSDVSFIDSTGLRALWVIRQRFAAVGGRLSLGPLSESVERLLQVTKLDKVFDVTEVEAG